MIVIASIHQPSTAIFGMFHKALVLTSSGRTAFYGGKGMLRDIFGENALEDVLRYANTDFKDGNVNRLESLRSMWQDAPEARIDDIVIAQQRKAIGGHFSLPRNARPTGLHIQLCLLQRSFLKSYRDVVPYGIRIAMYLGLAILMGSVWYRLEPSQDNIQAFENAIFFGGAFMSFMAVAYIPAYLEDRAMYTKERANGLYGPATFLMTNFLIGTPYLFLIAASFSTLVYWMSNFRPSAIAFFVWIGWLFLDLLAAEGLVVLVSSLKANFVIALAGTAFSNGIWMCTNGFLVPTDTLNAFWRYVFHYIDYQAYVFEGMMVNEFSNRNYTCGLTRSGYCDCLYQSDFASDCLIDGRVVLDKYGFTAASAVRGAAILVCLIVAYRFLGLCVLHIRKV